MARSGKKVGGLRGVNTKAPRSVPTERGDAWEPPKKIGGLSTPYQRGKHAFSSGSMKSCPNNCPGEYRHGKWIHSDWCEWAPILWKADNKKKEDWKCPFQCEVVTLSQGWTHHHQCEYWNRFDETPF